MSIESASDLDWRARGRCNPGNAHLFDPIELKDRADPDRRRIEQARRVCAGCPVTTECLRDALLSKACGVRAGHLLSRGKRVRLPSEPRVRAA